MRLSGQTEIFLKKYKKRKKETKKTQKTQNK